MSTTTHTLSLEDPHARMGKIANNLEQHGEEEVTAFAIPLTLMLGAEALNALMGKYFYRVLYNTNKDNLREPVEGLRRCKPLELEDGYEGVRCVLGLGPSEQLEFTDCKAQKLTLEPQVGGLTKLTLQLYLRPGIGDKNLALQEHQHREIAVTLTDGKVALKKNPKQQALPLEQDGGGNSGREPSGGFRASKSGEDVDAALHARHPELADEVMGEEAPH